MTLSELKERNRGYFLGAEGINEKDLKIVNNIIEAIESSRTNKVQTLDLVEYTDKYGGYYPHAMAEFNTYHDDKFSIVQRAGCYINLYNGELSHSISGGSFDSDKDESKFIYQGKGKHSFWTFSSQGAGGHHGLYFEAEVSKFVYNERAEELKHLTTQYLTKLYISDRGTNTREQYRYTASQGAYSYTAWKNEKELNAFLTKYKAIEEYRNKYHRVIWILNPKDCYCFNREEFEAINAPEFIKWWNGNNRPHKEVINGNDLITYVDRSEEPKYSSN